MSVPAAFLGIIIIWSTTPLGVKWSGEGLGFLFGLTAHMLLGVAVCLIIMAVLREKLPWHRAARRTYVIAGLGLYGAMMLVYWGAQHIPSGLIAVVFGLTPFITGILAAWCLREKSFTLPRITGMILGIGGLAVIFVTSEAMGSEAILGLSAVFISTLIHSISSVMVKKSGAQIPALATTTGALLFAVPCYLISWWIFDGRWPQQAPFHAVAAIIYLGVFGSALGFIFYFHALRHMEASRLAMIPLITPVLALVAGNYFNAEPITTNVIIGTAMILSGLFFYEWKNLVMRIRL